MSDPMTRLSMAMGDTPAGTLGTPGIAPDQAPQIGPPPGMSWWQWILTAPAWVPAGLGAQFGYQPPPGLTPRVRQTPAVPGPNTIINQAEQQAQQAPLQAPAEAAKAALAGVGPDWTKGITTWAQTQGRVVGIYGALLVVGVVGLVFLLSAAKGGLK